MHAHCELGVVLLFASVLVTSPAEAQRAVDYDTFMNVSMPDKTGPQRLYKPDGLDFRLKPGSLAIDAGVELPSITDGFTGKAPDIGAYEEGRPLPRYGPRK